MTTQTLSLLLIVFVTSLAALTVLAIHGLIPGLVAAAFASSGLTGAFGFVQASGSSKSTLTPTSATVTEITK